VTESSIGDAKATVGAAGGRSAPVNGLQIYDETHGPAPGARPPLLLTPFLDAPMPGAP
jgi:hypothetical protein